MPLPLPTKLVPLAKLFEKDDPKVLVVVGAGVSVGASSASHASWLGLLKHGVKHLVATEAFTEKRGEELSASLDAAFFPFDLKSALQHAELVEQNLTTPDAAAFPAWLNAAFRDFTVQAERNKTLDALRDLQQAGALLLTTNYDSLLSEATGLPPVTWEEHSEFFQVVRGNQLGILHIHGHWQRPSSVVLGKSSYDRIVQDQDFQDVFKSLWLERSWLYVGCGNGLNDANLGRLLEWGKRWNKGTPPDYFFAKTDEAIALENRPDKPANLVSVGYPAYTDLPDLLLSFVPTVRCWPFMLVDSDFPSFRHPASPSNIPFPSWKEYIDGEVPMFTAEAEVRNRLEQHGWSFILGAASVGKTTLALRLATGPEQRDQPTFYLDLATVDADDEDASAAMRRLLRPASLLILDNVHHNPELARHLWELWRNRPRGSRLLLLATRIDRAMSTAPAQDLAFFEHHSNNPSIELRPTPGDLGHILKHIYRRVAGLHATPLPVPPAAILQGWHRDYGSALNAFCLAVFGRLAEFQNGNWELPIEAASAWVREKWLKPLDAENLENVLCLAAFGSQELELEVRSEALPHPNKFDQLLRLGLVVDISLGRFGQYHKLKLREPGWGRLLLAAQVPAVNEEKILFDTAARHPLAAVTLSARLRREKSFDYLKQLWAHLAATPHNLIRLIPKLPLLYFPNLVRAAKSTEQPQLAKWLWEALEKEPAKLADHTWETPLDHIAFFLDTANRHGRETTPLWEALEKEPVRLADRAWETSLGHIASFLDTAKRHGRETTPLWEALEKEPARLAGHAWETPLDHIASFLDTAKRHGRETTPLWEAFEKEPARLADRAWETPLDHIASFLDTANRHGRETTPLWEALEKEPARLVDRAWETPLDHIISFLDTAKRHGRETTPIWEAFEKEPARLADRAWETSLGHIASFLDTAKRHGRETTPFWEALEKEPVRLAGHAWETPLDHIASFLDTAKRHGRETTPFWEALEKEPAKLADHAWETPLDHIAFFLDTAKRHGREITPFWEALEKEPARLVDHAWETPLDHIAFFLDTAKRHSRETTPLWEAFEKEPARLADRAWETPLDHIASFLDTAKRHGRETTPLWEALEKEPARLADRAWETSLGHIAFFLDTAKRHGRETTPFWEAFEKEPARLADRAWETPLDHIASFLDTAKRHQRDSKTLVGALECRPTQLSARARQINVGQLAGFCHHAPDTLVKIAMADFQATYWDGFPVSESLDGATWVAARCGEVGREDIELGLVATLLRRASPRDFPPRGTALERVAWLLTHTSAEAASLLVPEFLDAICTKRWLRTLFTRAACGTLAAGLRTLMMHQPPEVLHRFRHPRLGNRLQKELFRFTQLGQQERAQIIQLLGCATLCGWSARSSWFDNLSLGTIGTLPVDALPHRAEAIKVENWQFQLWLGLRAVTKVTGKPLVVPSAATAQTLDLWRCNVAESSINVASVEHRVNLSMVAWLERCLRENQGLLPPAAVVGRD